ncbi:MAG: ABC transporter permease [Halobacteriales archaeon]
MVGWRVRRIGQAVITVYVVLTLSFLVTYTMPGSPVNALLETLQEQGITGQAALRQIQTLISIDPSKPVHLAYYDYMVDMLQGDLGRSIWSNRPVATMIAERAPWTVFLLSWATFISFFVGIILGAFMAYYEGGKLDVGLSVYAMIAGSVPYYIWAIAFLVLFTLIYPIFPTTGRKSVLVEPGFTLTFIVDIVKHAALPLASLIISGSLASLSMRGNSIRVLGEDYIYVAHVRGLSDTRIALQYVLRNAVLPLYTGFLISIGAMLGGAIILEQVFNYAGMGLLFLDSLSRRDYPVIMGCFLVITVGVVIALLIADLTYSKLDPRARGGSRESF